VPWGALGKNVFAECRAQEALGKICFQKIKKHFAECPKMTLGKVFLKKIKTNFAERLAFPSARHSAKSRFAEWLTLPSD